MADGFGLKEKLDGRISAARRSLFWPSLVRSALPAILWFTAFAAFWLTGLYTPLPPEIQATIGVVFWIGLLVAALIGLKVWNAPTDDEARDLIDGSIEGRPLRAWADRPARTDAAGWTLWQEHRDRMAALALKQGRIDVAPHWKQADPFYLRFAAPAVLVVAGVIAGLTVVDRMGKGLFPDYRRAVRRPHAEDRSVDHAAGLHRHRALRAHARPGGQGAGRLRSHHPHHRPRPPADRRHAGQGRRRYAQP